MDHCPIVCANDNLIRYFSKIISYVKNVGPHSRGHITTHYSVNESYVTLSDMSHRNCRI